MAEPDANPTQGFKATSQQLGDWGKEQDYWRTNWSSRPYASADRGFEYYSPGYRYGFESAHKHAGKQWSAVEGDLRTGWDRYEHRGTGTWEHMKDAIRDGWNRIAHGA
ncbi:MAG: hypothetical protein JJD97_07200 [Gemmatimonadaceae bacterium]|nr:hypothetical protein [Gemmatimonadaceae bacterium]